MLLYILLLSYLRDFSYILIDQYYTYDGKMIHTKIVLEQLFIKRNKTF